MIKLHWNRNGRMIFGTFLWCSYRFRMKGSNSNAKKMKILHFITRTHNFAIFGVFIVSNSVKLKSEHVFTLQWTTSVHQYIQRLRFCTVHRKRLQSNMSIVHRPSDWWFAADYRNWRNLCVRLSCFCHYYVNKKQIENACLLKISSERRINVNQCVHQRYL